MKRVPLDDLIRFGAAFLVKRGVPQANAAYLSRVVMETEAFRQTTHGLVQLEAMHEQIGEKLDPAAEPVLARDRGSMALIDGSRAFGNLAMKLAVEQGMSKARTHGVAFVAVRRSEWVGALGIHLIPIARQGLLAHAWAQTSGCKDCAPFGGVEARFSTNPVALTFPTDGEPVLADFSTATMSLGAAKRLAAQGKRTATPRFLDRDGQPTDDPGVMDHGGTLLFTGCDVEGYKAYGLSLFIEALTVLAGGSANNPDVPAHQAVCLLVLDPASFGGADGYAEEMKRFIAHVRSARPRPDHGPVRLPGERGFAALADCRRNGVPLDDAKLAMLRRLAEAVGLEPVA